MHRSLIALTSAVLTCTVWLSSQQQQQQPPVFRGGTNVVEVDVYPTKDGRILEGLTAADFDIREDGVLQEVDQVEFIRIEPYTPDTEVVDPNNQREMLEKAADPHNRVFVAYLDRYHVRAMGSHATKTALVDLLQRILAPNDLFGAITTGMPVRRLPLGRKTHNIEQQLTQFWWDWFERSSTRREEDEDRLAPCFEYSNGLEIWGADQAVSRPLMDVLRQRRREDLVLTHLEELVAYLGQIREARKSVMLFTEGWILFQPDRAGLERVLGTPERAAQQRTSVGVRNGQLVLDDETNGVPLSWCLTEAARLYQLDDASRFRNLMRLANQHNVTFYPVNPSGIQVFDSAPNERVRVGDATAYLQQEMGRVRERRDALETLAANTDGLAIVDNDLPAGLRRIVDDVSAYYVLTYASTNTKTDGTYRRIDVAVRQPEVRVRARRGYFASEPASAHVVGAADPAAEAKADVEGAFGALSRLRLDATLFTYGTAAGDQAAVIVELPAARAARITAGLPVRVELRGSTGELAGSGEAEIAPATRGAIVRIPIPEGEGPWRANISVGEGRDRMQDSIELPASAGSFVGEALVFRATPSPRSPLIPVADFQFRRTERVHVEWPRLGAIDRREARLLGRNGQPLAVPVTLTERESDGRATVAADVNLAPLTDGEYAIELVVGRGSETERRVVAIRVTR